MHSDPGTETASKSEDKLAEVPFVNIDHTPSRACRAVLAERFPESFDANGLLASTLSFEQYELNYSSSLASAWGNHSAEVEPAPRVDGQFPRRTALEHGLFRCKLDQRRSQLRTLTSIMEDQQSASRAVTAT